MAFDFVSYCYLYLQNLAATFLFVPFGKGQPNAENINKNRRNENWSQHKNILCLFKKSTVSTLQMIADCIVFFSNNRTQIDPSLYFLFEI